MTTSPTSGIRIMLVDDHTVVRTGLRMLIESHSGLAVVGEAANRAEALALAVRQQPDIILLDLDLAGQSGLDMLSEIHSAASGARVIVLTGLQDSEVHRLAVRQGALGVVVKDQAAEVLVQAIEQVYGGKVWLEPVLLKSLFAEKSRATRETHPEAHKIATLTGREREVVALICEGLQNKSIGQRLSISETTVRHHLTSIFDKLDMANRLELVIYAYRHGLDKRPRGVAM
jgi:two-component system nitrate/nitrite response regulator NarL